MKHLLILLLIALGVQSVQAQAPRRRAEQQAAQKRNTEQLTTRAQIEFPTMQPMSEDVVWRRDIYRELKLTDEPNSPLYYPVEPVGSQMNLFTTMFKLMMIGPNRGGIAAYEYRMDGNEVFSDSARIKPLQFLDNYHIYYERQNGRVHLDNSDIPSREVKSYYIKESSYFDQATATFHTKVIALCPIMEREDDFGDGVTKYPLFWVKYDDVAPFLSKQHIMTSNLNNAATMSIDDYFAKNQYRGKIYKTTNMLGQTLAQYCPTDSAMAREQRRIEGELKLFEQNLWGDKARKDSLDSIAKAPEPAKSVKKKRTSTRNSGSSSVRTRRASSPSSSSSGSAARVSVRRQRH